MFSGHKYSAPSMAPGVLQYIVISTRWILIFLITGKPSVYAGPDYAQFIPAIFFFKTYVSNLYQVINSGLF